ncbi:MAG: hypothetical protein HYU71_05695 [Bacteroidetes bacterium]|nr:hypothetical protein [Bacteroidota bacterium]
MKTRYLLLFVLFFNPGLAQQAKQKYKTYFIPQLALLNGDHSVSGQVSLSCSWQKNVWSYGIGAAVDYYKVRSAPLFAELRKEIGKGQTPFFAYLNLGPNITWPLASDYRQNLYNPWFVTEKSRFMTGIYSEFGLGYSLWSKNKRSVMISLGYSTKTLSETYHEMIYPDFPPYDKPARVDRRLDYTYNRIALKVGCRL